MDLDDNNAALALLKEKRKIVTEPVEPTEAMSEEPAEEEAEPESESEELEQPEVDSLPEQSEEEEPGVYLIGDEEVTLDTILGWKKGDMRTADYTIKTMAVADQRKSYEAKESKLSEREGVLTSLIEELESSISSQEKAVDWDDLALTDPSEFLLQQRKVDVRKETLKKSKAANDKRNKDQSDTYANSQQEKIRGLLPAWFDGSDSQQKDLKLIGDYLAKNGYSDQEMAGITDARHWKIFLDAAKQQAFQEKVPLAKKKLKNAPKLIKPSKSRAKQAPLGVFEDAAKRLKKSGSEADAMDYLKAKRAK